MRCHLQPKHRNSAPLYVPVQLLRRGQGWNRVAASRMANRSAPSEDLLQALVRLPRTKWFTHTQTLVLRAVHETIVAPDGAAPQITAKTPLVDAGLDSINGPELEMHLQNLTGMPLEATFLFDLPKETSAHTLTMYLLERLKRPLMHHLERQRDTTFRRRFGAFVLMVLVVVTVAKSRSANGFAKPASALAIPLMSPPALPPRAHLSNTLTSAQDQRRGRGRSSNLEPMQPVRDGGPDIKSSPPRKNARPRRKNFKHVKTPCPGGGILGSHGVPACCAPSCGVCGGKSCKLRPGGPEACCGMFIKRPCGPSSPPPCILNSSIKL